MKSINIDEKVIKQAQDCYAAHPVLVLGSGSSVPFKMPTMKDLTDNLVSNISVKKLGDADIDCWNNFKDELSKGTDLETALHKIQLSDELSKRVIKQTWHYINTEDLKIFKESLRNRNYFPLSSLISRLFNSTHRKLEIVTTNYDRLAEYAVENANFLHYTGFTYGYTRRMEYPQKTQHDRIVNIWKVHGSLDWYKDEDGELIALANTEQLPAKLFPVIVTPGIEKYRQTHLEPYRSIIQGADNALSGADSYLCIGYGFNDQHIQEKLVNRCIKDDTPVVVLARTLSESAKDFLLKGKCKNYLALERDGTSTVIHSSSIAGSITVKNTSYWSFEKFLGLIM